jgi:electron transfer flavoprotein alpha subunit
MSVLVYAENTGGQFKKSVYELISYGKAIADLLKTNLSVVSIGNVSNENLAALGKYGAAKVLSFADNEKYNSYDALIYASIIGNSAHIEKASVVLVSNSFGGKGIAPRIAVKLKASFASGAIELPEIGESFIVKTGAYSGKAFAHTELKSDVKVISLNPNSYKVIETGGTAEVVKVESYTGDEHFKCVVKEIVRATDKISLPDAELVVSGGRGLKGPENWGMIEEMANLLGAATACSKPVSDADWRPHSEHVGQTGIAISPNLYIAVGISGAIQHLAGVSSSKCIVVINKDAEAPFFKAADYGIVGDAFEVVPKLIEALKKFKAAHN